MAKRKDTARVQSRKGPAPGFILDNPHGFTDPHVLKGLKYAQDVVAGRVEACLYVKQACQRQLDDLERWQRRTGAPFQFDEAEASRVCRFMERLPHIEGPLANAKQLLVLEPWQCFVYTTVFGWHEPGTGRRRFREAYIEVPRGNGKSFMASGTALYALAADREEGAQVYSAATTRHQAKIVWRVAKSMMLKRPAFQTKLGVTVHETVISKPKTFSRFEALSREAKNQDGLNIHVAVVDELHAHKTREVYDVIQTGAAKRLRSLIWIITTAGSDSTGICYEQRLYVQKILAREEENDAVFGIVFTIDKDDDWKTERAWRKANPNWGVSVDEAQFKANAKKALATPQAQANFKIKHLCVWANANQPWMDMERWDACADPGLSEDQFLGQELFEALDLASKIDVAAKFKLFRRAIPNGKDPNVCITCGELAGVHRAIGLEPDPRVEYVPCMEFKPTPTFDWHYYGFLECFVPEDVANASHNSHYKAWVDQGLMHSTPGPVIDYSAIEASVVRDAARFRMRECGYDNWQAQSTANNLRAAGITMVEVPQQVKQLSEPMKEWDASVRAGRFHHNGCPVLRWMVSNVVCHYDAKDNVFPRKIKPELKIDGAVAGITAFNRVVVYAGEVSPYNADRGFLTL